MQNKDIFGALTRKLGRLAALNEGDREAIASLPATPRSERANAYLVREGDDIKECCLLIHGYACRHKTTRNGGRQIVSFHLPGDILDVQHLMLPRADHNVQAITDVEIACIPVERLRALMRERPGVSDALWRDTLIDASIFREWVLNVGRRNAKARIAHMLCEFAARRDAAGLGSPERFDLPMTQEQIADATGLTSVHVNRMLRELADEGIIARDRRTLHIIDWPRMTRAADFDIAYLHAAA